MEEKTPLLEQLIWATTMSAQCLWTCWMGIVGKAIIILQKGLQLENLEVNKKLLKDTKAKTNSNGGHGLRDLYVIPGLHK